MFKNLFKKNQYGNSLHFEEGQNECSHCNDIPQKLKKCDDCGKKNICRNCYYENHKLCKCCEDKYNKWANSLQEVKQQTDIKKKYNFKIKNKFLSSSLLQDY